MNCRWSFCILSAVDNRRYKRILYDVQITIPLTMISGLR